MSCRLLKFLSFCILPSAFCLLPSAFCLSSYAFTDQIEKLGEGIQRHQLENGLVCLIKKDCSAPLVSIQVWVGTGSAQEGEYLGGGLSHLVEHMIFKGTPRRKPADISMEIDNAGGSINAYTTLDRTVFWADMPAESWLKGLDVLSDAVLNASFPADEWRREKDVVRREMAMGKDNPGNVLSKLLFQTAYHVHPYRFPVIGKEEIFNTLSREDLVAFFRRHYTPDNMIIAVVGNIEEAAVLAEIDSRFKEAGRRARPPAAQPGEPPQLSPRSARKTGVYNISRLEMSWHTVGLSHADAPALDIFSVIAGGGKSSRLVQQIKEKRKLAFSIDAWSYTPKDAGLFGISATFDPAKEEELIKAIEEEVAGWRTGSTQFSPPDSDARTAATSARSATNVADKSDDCSGRSGERQNNSFTAAEVDKARNKMAADTLLAFRTMHGKADTFASGEFYAGTPLYFSAYLKRLADVTPASLQALAGKYLKDDNRTTVILSPALTNRPAGEINRAAAEIKVIKKQYPNGLTLLCSEDRRLPFVDFCIASQGGLLMENPENNGITCLMAELLTRGTSKRNQEQIADEVETKSGSVTPFAGMNSYGLKSRCFSKDAGVFMEILSDCRLDPVFPEEEIAKARAVQIARIEQQRESPMFLAQEAMRGALFSGHPYSLNMEGSRESVMKITRENLRAIHAGTTTGSNTVIAVFGDISPGEAAELAEKYFGKMPTGKRPDVRSFGNGNNNALSQFSPPEGAPRTASTPARNATSVAGGSDRCSGRSRERQNSQRPDFPRHIELTAPREQTVILAGCPGFAVTDKRLDALDMALNALNGLSSDLMISVRDRKGLAYYTGAYHRAGIAGGQFAVYAGTRAEEAARVHALIMKEIKRLAGEGLRADELERARRQIITEHRQKLQVNAAIAMDCALDELYGLGFEHALETEKRVGQVSPDDVRQAAADLLRPDKMVTVTVKPEK
jgi:zinc protease